MKKNSLALLLNKCSRWTKREGFSLISRNGKWEAISGANTALGETPLEAVKNILKKITYRKCTLCSKSFLRPSPHSTKFYCYRHSKSDVHKFLFTPQK